ncbi:hypothetical protein BscR1v2_006480 [Bartonella schoenbuchensis R1]|uniref:Uncharacterized protein n=1 Tax=Bartonella schoenbuchensis (strain DSM 13525 / NCTC 13165 / R1) TaxID=687861 RepID=E6YYW2_BARSR|nr:hypothetical protein BscR1v2_006480 [Bartonella schoenbuchensis R1]CBI82123.1 hypothetical protein B11C_20401 [Bartonella schoenbuchensis R1]
MQEITGYSVTSYDKEFVVLVLAVGYRKNIYKVKANASTILKLTSYLCILH